LGPKSNYITAIDIGTTKVSTLIGLIKKNNSIDIKGYGTYPCKGIKKGVVVDIGEATKSILNSVEKAEKATKLFVDSAFIGVTGKHVSFINNWSEISIGSASKVVKKSDIDKLISQANKVKISSEHEVIHTLIKQFAIGEETEIIDPIGLTAEKLAVELLITYGSTTQLKNVINSVRGANIEIDDIILEALASSESVLSQDEKDSGVIMLDIGGGTTDVAIYKNKKMIFTYCLPVGGDLITNDISIGLNIPFAKAEEIKKKFANVDLNFYETLNKMNMGELKIDRNKTTLNIRLYSIVNARMKEMFEIIKQKIESYGLMYNAPCGLVITGGTANLKGINSLAGMVFDMPVRTGVPIDIEGPSDVVGDPIYSTATGLLKYANQIQNFAALGKYSDRGHKNPGFLQRFRDFIGRVMKSES